MRKKASMMQPTTFTDFNPLDVLAAAASLQRRTEESDDGENEGNKTGTGTSAEEEAQDGAEDEDGGATDKTLKCHITALSDQLEENKTKQCDHSEGLPEESAVGLNGGTEEGGVDHGETQSNEPCQAVQGPSQVSEKSTPETKAPTMTKAEDLETVLITPPPVLGSTSSSCRSQITDHSYAFVSHLQNLKAEEDEGYSSRSSLDDDSEETVFRLSHKNGQYIPGWGTRSGSSIIGQPTKMALHACNNRQRHDSEQSSVASSDVPRKSAKIVILSKDSKLQHIISGINSGSETTQPSNSTNGSSVMLRTLLGQKAGVKASAQGQSKVIIAGGLSGHVINALKSGGISLSPPQGSEQDVASSSEEVPNGIGVKPASNEIQGSTDSSVEAATIPSTDKDIDSTTYIDSETDKPKDEEDLIPCTQSYPAESNCDESSLATGPETPVVDTEDEGMIMINLGEDQKQSRTLSEISSQHDSEVVTEDETSCDSTKGDIMVDTTPVMSPSVDLTSPLMSPVCERDVPMMSPMVGSPEVSCDIFKLPSCIKTKMPPDSPVFREGQCNLTVRSVVNEETGNACLDPAIVTDMPGYSTDEETASGLQPDETIENSSESVMFNSESPLDSDPYPGMELPDPSASQEGVGQQSESNEQCEGSDGLSTTPSMDKERAYKQNTDKDYELEPTSNPPVADDAEAFSYSESDSVTGQDVTDAHENKGETRSTKNQYIIEDDESPVAKFGTPKSSADEEGPSSECSSPLALATNPLAVSLSGNQTHSQLETLDAVSPVKLSPSGNDAVKVIMTTEASSNSVFTKVHRPLVSGVKALSASLHMVPVVPSSKSGVMHVVPVSRARGVVTQIIPKPGAPFLTGVPVLSGKTVVLPDNSKGTMNTILVPVSVANNPTTAPVSLVQTSKAKFANLQTSVVKTELETPHSPKVKRRELSSPLVFHGRITPVSATSETSDLLSSPESSLHGGFSGVIMSGRKTPDILDNSKPSSRMSLENSKDKISIKISSNSVMESDDSMSSEAGFASTKKETIGIGKMGSLSWKNFEPASPRGLTPIGSGGAGREFVRIQGGELRTGLRVSDEDTMPPLEKPAKRTGRAGKNSDGKGSHVNNRKNKRVASESGSAQPPPTVTEQFAPQVAELHPLIDHDYCMFTEFNAQIQSSIIATTESKTKIERKYAKKTKAVRTKAVRGLITEESLKGMTKGAVEKIVTKGRRGRFKKKHASKEKVTTDEEVSLDGTEGLNEVLMAAAEEKPRKSLEQKPSRTSERRAKLQALKDDKNYVKITGSYQDEFVYFATKNKRNRPRKSLEDQNSLLKKQPQVGGMTVFDWYKDLSKADKTSRFGTPTTSCPASPVPTFATPVESDSKSIVTPAVASRENLQKTTNSSCTSTSQTVNNTFRSGATPIHESEVADLVCDLSEINTLGSSESTVTPVNDMDLSSFIIGAQEKSEPVPAVRSTSDPASPATTNPPVSVDHMAEMAEQVREMLNNMGADELENLELKFGDVDPAASGMTDPSFDGLLGGFTQEEVAPPISVPVTTNNLCDLDEINDSDLLQSDLGILSDVKPSIPSSNTLKPSSSAPSLLLNSHSEQLPTADTSSFGFSKTLEFSDSKLDKSELFPDMAPPAPPASADVSILAANTAPELTVVSMYWNDLPGLVLIGQQYVRLVDIHKQVLPAKDTGILKKRCQMMGLSIANCSELQRDFLVRYANAAKSKSTVIVSKEAAQTLIGFYVEPKSRPSKQAMEERGIALAEQARAQAAAAAALQGREHRSQSTVNPTRAEESAELSSPSPGSAGGKRVCGKGTKGVRRKRRLTGGSGSDNSPVSASPGVSTIDVKRSARLRHKTVSYADMLLGNHYENHERKDDVVTAMSAFENCENQKEGMPQQDKTPSIPKKQIDGKDKEKMVFPEDIEIKKLRVKMRLKCLSPKDKRRLRRLREKVRKREMKRKLRERRKLDRLNGRKKAVAVALANIVKTKKKLQQTHVFTKKYNTEHCYAAAPVSPDKKVKSELQDKREQSSQGDDTPAVKAEILGENLRGSLTPLREKILVVDQEIVDTSKDRNCNRVVVPCAKGEIESDMDVDVTVTPEAEITPVMLNQDKIEPEDHVLIKSKMKKVELQNNMEKIPSPAPRQKRPPIAVLHRDAVQRLSQRSRWQDGQLHIDMFIDRQSVCICCTTCGEFFSVKRFMKHMHHQNNADELAHVTLTQTLELRAADVATAEEHAIWAEFQDRKEELLGPVTPRQPSVTPRRQRSTLKSPSVGVKVAGAVKAKSQHPAVKRTIKTPLSAVRNMVKTVATNSLVNNGTVISGQGSRSTQCETISVPQSQVMAASPLTTSVSGTPLTSGKISPKTVAVTLPGHREGTSVRVTKIKTVVPGGTPAPQAVETSVVHKHGEKGNIRHSTRVRKQKQLHPIEKYVFSKSVSPANSVSPGIGEPPAKKPRLTGERDSSSLGSLGRELPIGASTPMRKVRLRLSNAAATAKYDLRMPSDAARQ